MSSKTLYLLDGMALVYRAHFAFATRPIVNSKGVVTSAAFGFTNTLLDILQNRQPSHLAVAFDTAAPTARHTAFPAYKAQREEMPEDLAAAIPHVKALVRAFHIPVLELDGHEADDLIGTLARRAEKDGFTTYMVTPDKDFGQLVDAHTFIYKPGRQGADTEILGPEEVCARWGIARPEQVIDLLGLMGDTSDNIPGIPGIGEKTAAKLIAQFGSLDALLASTDQLKGKQKESVEKFADQARLSRQLATINCSVPMDPHWDELKVGAPDEPALRALFAEFEFNTLGKRVFGDTFQVARGAGAADAARRTEDGGQTTAEFSLESEPDRKPGRKQETENKKPETIDTTVYRTIADVTVDYRRATTESERAELIKLLKKEQAFCFDTETSSLDPKDTTLVGLAFSWQAGTGWFLHLPPERKKAEAILHEFAPVFTDPSREITGHNLKFDLAVLAAHRLEVKGQLFDTMIAHALVEPDQRHGMDFLSEVYLGYRPISITTLIGEKEKGQEQRTMLEADPAEVARYAAEDADVTWQLREKLLPLLQERQQEKVFREVEMPLLPALVAMESAGIAIDIFALEEFSQQLAIEIEKARADVFAAAGHEFNLSSPKQLGVVLFDELKLIDKPKKTATGQYKTDEQTLTDLADNPIVARLLDYRAATKLKSTYVDALPNEVSKKTNRVHTTYHQATTSTGRLASSDPNLQNIPIRTEMGREIRKAFVPGEKGWKILSADYSQIELRLIAAMSRDEAMISAFKAGHDIHAATAAKVYGVHLEDVDKAMRGKAKMVNFGIVYGISAFGLSQRLHIPRTEAAELINGYFNTFPGIKAYMDETIAFARKHGYVETLTGRRRPLRDINSANQSVRGAAERNAINMPVQGTAADLIKIAMARIHERMQKLAVRSRMLLQVHDELVFELAPGEEATLRELLQEIMPHALPEVSKVVPIEIEIGTGSNWLEAH
ncbi:MAG: DNA polymerase I [Candidatus Methylacidiphilales bacterium]|nr:DNA polymerase I [Candidatus Methylacidiphilales bacterium]